MDLSNKLIAKSLEERMQVEIPITRNSRLYEMLEAARYITDTHKENPDMIAVNILADIARERAFC